MNTNETIYPQSVEERLQIIVEHAQMLKEDFHMHDSCIREAFGPVLMEQWLSGDDESSNLDAEGVFALFQRACAMTILKDLMDEGLVDVIDSDEGDIVFLTEKGKKFYQTHSANIQNII